ncbi:MAG: hypothetical protein U1F58_00350 [Burkholderiales bacterium]
MNALTHGAVVRPPVAAWRGDRTTPIAARRRRLLMLEAVTVVAGLLGLVVAMVMLRFALQPNPALPHAVAVATTLVALAASFASLFAASRVAEAGLAPPSA